VALALYRKYRPRTFAEVIGQEHVTEPLSQALRSGRLHHAFLFSGPRGCGKTSSARILARSLNCDRGPTPEPCGVCESCRALATDGGGSIDVIEIDAASHGGVDDARELRERAFFAAAASRFKIYVIDEAHMVSTQGFNALLKLVEEPPDYVTFIFATTEPDKVLGTIKSRTHHYPFRLIPPSVMRPYLEQLASAEGVKVEPAVFPLVVRAGGGSVRDALSVLDQLIAGAGPEGVSYARAVALLGVTDAALIDEMVDALAATDGAAAYATIDRVVEAGHDPRRFASDLLERLRDLIVIQQVPDAAAKGLIDGPTDQLERMGAQAARLGPATLSRGADIVHNGLIEMRGTTAPRLLLELITARMLLPATGEGEAALLQRVERMERRLTLTGGQDHDPGVQRSAAPMSAPPAAGVGAPDGGRDAARAAARGAARAAATEPASPPGEADGGAARGRGAAAGGASAGRPAVLEGADDGPPRGPAPAGGSGVGPAEGGGSSAAGRGGDRSSGPGGARSGEDADRPGPASARGSAVGGGSPGGDGPGGTGSEGDAQRAPNGGASAAADGPRSASDGGDGPGGPRAGRDGGGDRAADGHDPGRPAGSSMAGGPTVAGGAAGGAQTAGEAPAQGGTVPAAPRAVPATAVMPDPATPEPVVPGSALGAALDAAAVRRVWDDILTVVGNKSKKVAAWAREATVREIDGDTLVLTFRHSFHARALAEQPELVAEAAYEVLGGRWQIRCEMAGDQLAAQPGARATRRSAPAPSSQAPPAAWETSGGDDWPEPARPGGVAPTQPPSAHASGSGGREATRAAAADRAWSTASAAPAGSDRAGDPPLDPDSDEPTAQAAPTPATPPAYAGFDPGDEPTDQVVDEKAIRQSSEQQALHLLQQHLGAERIGEVELR
jgi:DNA polymerase-3 subunit gamma/tau